MNSTSKTSEIIEKAIQPKKASFHLKVPRYIIRRRGILPRPQLRLSYPADLSTPTVLPPIAQLQHQTGKLGNLGNVVTEQIQICPTWRSERSTARTECWMEFIATDKKIIKSQYKNR